MKKNVEIRQFISSAQKILVTSAAVGLLSTGCGEMAVRSLESTTPQGSAFNNALSKEYLAFATSEARSYYDQGSASHFADKGLKAAQNLSVDPENLAEWTLPSEVVPEMSAARDRLVAALNNGARVQNPQGAAQAQQRFDCWVEEQQENWQTENIQACRGDFYAYLAQIEQSQPPLISPQPAPQVKPQYTSFQAQAVYFDFDKSNIKPEAQAIITKSADLIKTNPDWRIMLDGHADRTGREKYNHRLSAQRAHEVKKSLIQKGVSADRLIEQGLGTKGAEGVEGKPHQADRRVDIHLMK